MEGSSNPGRGCAVSVERSSRCAAVGEKIGRLNGVSVLCPQQPLDRNLSIQSLLCVSRGAEAQR